MIYYKTIQLNNTFFFYIYCFSLFSEQKQKIVFSTFLNLFINIFIKHLIFWANLLVMMFILFFIFLETTFCVKGVDSRNYRIKSSFSGKLILDGMHSRVPIIVVFFTQFPNFSNSFLKHKRKWSFITGYCYKWVISIYFNK